MDGGLTRREILKGAVATASLPRLFKVEGNFKPAGQAMSSPSPAASRPADDELVAPSGWLGPFPPPATPGPDYAPPIKLAAPATDAPVIYEHTPEAGPDETFFLVGDRLTSELFVWGSSQDEASGQKWQLKIQLAHAENLAATLPEIAEDGPFLIWAGNSSGWSRPIRLNVPQPWWCGPDVTSPGDTVRIFGRNLARRPEYLAAFVYLALSGQPGLWLNAEQTGKYSLTVRMPAQLEPGTYQIWVHAGRGGAFGWGGPVGIRVEEGRTTASSMQERVSLPTDGHGVDLQRLLDQQLQKGGGTVRLDEGVFHFHGTLRVPRGVALVGSGRSKTRLQLVSDRASQFGPGKDAAAVWLAGDGASLAHLTVSGTSEVNLGVAVRSPEPLAWVKACRIEDVRISDIERKHTAQNRLLDNYGVRLMNAAYAVVRDCEIWARAPVYLSGVRQCCIMGNDLVPLAMWGGAAEATIMGRNEVVEECIIEGNRVGGPPGALAGGPTNHRLIWISTGHGSVSHNWIAGNGVKPPAGPGAPVGAGQPRFGGIAGTDQNVGEMILFEAQQRTMFFGKLAGADSQSVVLPQIVPRTPDNYIGKMLDGQHDGRRDLLAHDSAGNETPFWPPDADTGGEEPPIHEYYVSIFSGKGQGQTRRVLRREGTRLILDRPWMEAPTAGSLAAIGTAFYQNLIVENYTPDGMTGIQLWISCIENVIAGNSIARQRRQGIFLFASASTLASSMPRSWNSGIAPLFWNVTEGNRSEECSAGVLVTSGDDPRLPVEFPRALGNVIRHNSLLRNREDGVTLSGGAPEPSPGVRTTSPSVSCTIVEFNVVRDAVIAYHAASGSDDAVLRRNHAYFWFPVNNSKDLPVAFQVDTPDANVVIDVNNAEDKVGDEGANLIRLKRAKRINGTIQWTQE